MKSPGRTNPCSRQSNKAIRSGSGGISTITSVMRGARSESWCGRFPRSRRRGSRHVTPACAQQISFFGNRSIRVKAVYTELHRSHDPQFFLVRGVVKRTTEQPERADRLLKGLADGKHTLIEPTRFGQGPRARVHSPAYLSCLETAWDEWSDLPDSGPEMI